MAVGPWRDVPRPSDAEEARGAWELARIGSEQHWQAVRALWDDDTVLAVAGVVEVAKGEGCAFYYAPAGNLPRAALRLAWSALYSGVYWAHERGLRAVTAMVVASHREGHRLIRRLGFEPYGWAPGYSGSPVPMIRYLHCWPHYDEPALVRHQRFELWRACIEAWCPAYFEEIA